MQHYRLHTLRLDIAERTLKENETKRLAQMEMKINSATRQVGKDLEKLRAELEPLVNTRTRLEAIVVMRQHLPDLMQMLARAIGDDAVLEKVGNSKSGNDAASIRVEAWSGSYTGAQAFVNRVAEQTQTLDYGVAPLPYHDDVQGAPARTLADGASLWVGTGLKPAESKAVASFVNFVLGPETQINLTLAGGYLPMTPVARAAASSKLLKGDLAVQQVAYAELQGKPVVPTVRVSQVEPVRVIVEEELETVWANKKPAKEALDDAVARGNSVLSVAMAPTLSASDDAGKGSKKRGK